MKRKMEKKKVNEFRVDLAWGLLHPASQKVIKALKEGREPEDMDEIVIVSGNGFFYAGFGTEAKDRIGMVSGTVTDKDGKECLPDVLLEKGITFRSTASRSRRMKKGSRQVRSSSWQKRPYLPQQARPVWTKRSKLHWMRDSLRRLK